MRPGEDCPICRDPSVDMTILTGDAVRCERCGVYRVTYEFTEDVAPNLTREDRALLSGVIRNYSDRHKRGLQELITTKNYRIMMDASGAPTSVVEQIEVLFQAIARAAPYYGSFSDEEPAARWAARIYVPAAGDFYALADVLAEDKQIRMETSAGRKECKLSLLLKGWNRIPLIKESAIREQVFVAMWLNAAMQEIYDEGIRPAIEDTGLKSFLVTKDPPKSRIDDEIVAQIRKSRLVIADVTGERPNVYYEAGFAQGLGIPVIWCCNGSWVTRLPKRVLAQSGEDPEIDTFSWFDRLHFDTRQFPHIRWETAEELRAALAARIRAWALDLPKE